MVMNSVERDITKVTASLKEATATLQEIVRLLGKVVPEDQNKMIDWAVRSQDAVYTNAGAAFRVGMESLKKLGLPWQRPTGYRTD